MAAMAKASAATGAFSASSARNLTQVGSSMQTIGRRATTWLSLPVAAAGALAVKAAVDWESAWAGVTKTVEGTGAQLADLESGIRDMAKELPATHEEIAAVAEAAGALGVATPDILQFTRVMIDLGETTNLTADQAATSIAQLMNVMQTSGDDVDNLGSALVGLGNTGASTEGQILDMAQRIAGAGALIGLSEAEVLGFAAAMADLGIPAERGGTAVQRAFLLMNTAVDSGGAKLEAFADIAGMSGEQFATTFRDDAAGAVVAFVQGLARIEAESGNASDALGSIGLKGQLAQQVFLSLLGAGDSLNETLGRSVGFWEDNLALTGEAAKRYATTAAQFEIVRNKIVDLFIDLGATLLPIVSTVLDLVSSWVEGFQALPAPVQAAVGGFLALVAAAGPMMFITGSLIKNLAAINGLMKLSAGAAGLAGTAFAGIAIAATVGVLAYEAFTSKQRELEARSREVGAALVVQWQETLRTTLASQGAEPAIAGLAAANEALALALAQTDEDGVKLTQALGALGIQSDEAFTVLARFRDLDVESALYHLGVQAGLTAEEISIVGQAVNDTDGGAEDLSISLRFFAEQMGMTYEEAKVFAAELLPVALAMEEIQDQAEKTDLDKVATQALNAAAAASEEADELIRLAETQIGATRASDQAVEVYQRFNELLAQSDQATQDAVLGTESYTAAVEELTTAQESLRTKTVPTLDSIKQLAESFVDGASKIELLAAQVEMSGDKFKGLADKATLAAGAVDGVVDKLKASGKGLADIFGPDIGAMGAGFKTIGDEAGDAVGGVDDLAGSFDELEGVAGSTIDTMTLSAEAFDMAARAAANFGDELSRLTGGAIGVADAEAELWDWALKFNDALAAQDDELGHVNRSLSISTVEGNANVQMFQEQRDNILDLAAARLEDGEAIETVADDVLYNTGVMRDNALAAGFNREQFDYLLYTWGLTPEQVETAIVQAGMTTARQEIEALIAQYDNIPPEIATQLDLLLDHGQYEEARRLLNSLTPKRTAPVVAVAYTYDANSQLNALTKTRFTQILAKVKTFAEGGYIAQDQIAQIHGNEAVLPLGNPARMAAVLGDPRVSGPIMSALSAMGGAAASIGRGGGGMSGGGAVYNLTINHNGPGEVVPDAVVRALRQWERRSGPVPISTR